MREAKRGKYCRRDDGADEGRREQLLQLVHAINRRDRVAQRAQNVIAAQQYEVAGECERQRAALVRRHAHWHRGLGKCPVAPGTHSTSMITFPRA